MPGHAGRTPGCARPAEGDEQCTSANMDVKGSDSESDGEKSNAEGRKDYVQEVESEAESKEKANHVDITDTEASDGLLYEEVKTLVRKSAERKERHRAFRNKTKERVRNDSNTAKVLGDQAATKAYSRCSLPYFSEVVNSVLKSNHRVELVRDSGFGYLLELDDCCVPRAFAQWIADNVNTEQEAVVLNKKSIPLNAQSVQFVLGIPSGETPISIKEEEVGKASFLALFGLTEVPTIRFFGNKLMNEVLSDEDFIRCFMVVVLATFLCPTSNTKPSTKYMGALVDVKILKQLNWCSFVHEWQMWYVKKYQKEKLKQNRTTTLGGCIYNLAVRCLDFTDFDLIQMPSTMPRICVWKGELIKHFSDMTIGKDEKYGALPIKEESETCYRDGSIDWASTVKNSNFRKEIDRVVGNSFSDKVKEDIFNSFQNCMKDEDLNTCSKGKGLLLETLQIVTNATADSGDTVKVGSTGTEINSGDSTKLQSTEETEKAEPRTDLERRCRTIMTPLSTGAPPPPPPSEISRPKHPEHKLTLVPTGPAKFKCNGCLKDGTGADRYTCLQPSCDFDLHKDCALAQPRLVHPLLPKSTFELCLEAPRTKHEQLCSACGGYVQGLHYHSKYLYLHPCCAMLPMEIKLSDELKFELREEVSHCCTKCGKGGGVRDFWFYRSTGKSSKTVYLHVRCVIKDFLLPSSNTEPDVDDNGRLASFVNKTALRKHGSGKAGWNFDAICEIIKALASIILSLITGNPFPAFAAAIDLCSNLGKLKIN